MEIMSDVLALLVFGLGFFGFLLSFQVMNGEQKTNIVF